jgi:hypothetical protein
MFLRNGKLILCIVTHAQSDLRCANSIQTARRTLLTLLSASFGPFLGGIFHPTQTSSGGTVL